MIYGKDPTYDVIDQGAWLNEEPYATIHRLVSSGVEKIERGASLRAGPASTMFVVTNLYIMCVAFLKMMIVYLFGTIMQKPLNPQATI